MIQICIMSGLEGRLRPEKKIYFTLMGGMELTMPTLAQQILASRQRGPDNQPIVQKHFFLTLMGGVDIRLPTLAAEFLDLRELLRAGVIQPAELERCIAELGRSHLSISSFTLMGGLEEGAPPSDEAEIDSLAIHRHLGNISESAGAVLQLGIGQRESERWAAVRHAVIAAG